MPVIAKLNYLRIAPRKVRLAADLIRGKSVGEAQNILNFTTKKSVQPVLKLLKSAINSAKNNFQLEESNLYISKITVDEGPKYKRFFPRARGQAYEIQKKTSHITIMLDELRSSPSFRAAKTKVEKKKSSLSPPFAAARALDEAVKKPKKRAKKGKEAAVKSEEVIEKIPKMEKPKFAPKTEIQRPRVEKGLRRIFRRKAF